MKKRIFALILCAMLLLSLIPYGFAEAERAARYLEINEANFPDNDLRGWIIAHLSVSGSASGGYYMTEAQATGVNVISISGFDEVNGEELYLKKISLEGLQLFPNLEELYMDYIMLKPFRFAQLKNLKLVDCEEVYLANIDFSGCPALESINWDWGKGGGEISSINCSGCPNLKRVATGANKVNVKNCPKLETLGLLEWTRSGNPHGIAENVNTCPALKVLCCKVEGTIDLSACTALRALAVDGTIRSLDLSKNTALEYLSIGYESDFLEDLEEEYASRSARIAPGSVKGPATGLKTLDLSKNTALESLSVWCDTLTSLDLSHNTELLEVRLETAIPSIDFSSCGKLKRADISGKTETIDLSGSAQLETLYLNGPYLRSPDLSENTALTYLSIQNGSMTEIDVSRNAALKSIQIDHTPIMALDLSENAALEELTCSNGELYELDLSGNPNLTSVDVDNNHLLKVDLSHNQQVESFKGENQTLLIDQRMQETDSAYTFDLGAFTGLDYTGEFGYFDNVYEAYRTKDSNENEHYDGVSYDYRTGVVTADRDLRTLHYMHIGFYNAVTGRLSVTLLFPYEGDASVEWTRNGDAYDEYYGTVGFKGETPYVIFYENKAYEPPYRVIGDDDVILDSGYYTEVFENNDAPGTATLTVTMKNTGKTALNWFKIYLPPTEKTDVANRKDGVALSWEPVSGAKGYVIYRRAWSSTTDGWTEFKRWNNTTDTAWTDTKVYAGTRYQYGVKAYYSDPMDNYNLGEVGPLKTTTRITTRTLLGVDAGTKQFTARWDGSKTVTGYQIKYATDAKFTKNVGAVKVTRPDAYRTTIKGLTAGTTYYVTVRGYQVFNGMTYFGEWSNVLNCKVR